MIVLLNAVKAIKQRARRTVTLQRERGRIPGAQIMCAHDFC
jgi:hypothetical protein